MAIPLVITLVGADRTGLVESVARVVAEHEGNWLESRMCRLGGEFAGILRVEIPAEKKSALLAALQKISGLNVVIQPTQSAVVATSRRQTKLEIVGSDRPGIVREITSALARANVNLVQSQRTFAIAGTLRPRRAETRFGKNRRRFAGGRFLRGTFWEIIFTAEAQRHRDFYFSTFLCASVSQWPNPIN